MLRELWKEHTFMSCIILLGTASLVLQGAMALSLKGYVRASANMKTTRKKLMLNLKSQFEAIYGMDYQVRNISAYVDKYLLKLRFLGFSYSAWEKVPFLTAGLLMLFAGIGIFYGYVAHAGSRMQIEILFSCGVMLVCLFVFYHIFGIKSKKEQIQIQLADYLENYLTNRLIRNRESGRQLKLMDESMEQAVLTGTEGSFDEILRQAQKAGNASDIEEDMEMLKRLLREMDVERQEREQRAAERRRRAEAESGQQTAARSADAEFAAGAETCDGAGTAAAGTETCDGAAAAGTEACEAGRHTTDSCDEGVPKESADMCDEGMPKESMGIVEGLGSLGGMRERADVCDEGVPQESMGTGEGSGSRSGMRERADACDESVPQESMGHREGSGPDTGTCEIAAGYDEGASQGTDRMEHSLSSGESAEEGRLWSESPDGPEVISFEEAAAKKGSRSGPVTGTVGHVQAAAKLGTANGYQEQKTAKNRLGAERDPENAAAGQAEPSISEMAAAGEEMAADAFLPDETEIELLEEFVMSFLAQTGGAS